MSAEFLAMVAGVLLSLAFAYVPGLSDWFAALESVYKRLVMAGLMLVVAAGAVGLACTGLASDFGLLIACDRSGFVNVVQAFVLALVANQATYTITKS